MSAPFVACTARALNTSMIGTRQAALHSTPTRIKDLLAWLGLAWLDHAQLAAKRRGPLIALDAEIERDAGSSMNEMMLPYGQADCRCNERYALFRNAAGYTHSMVMPTVVSIVCETFN